MARVSVSTEYLSMLDSAPKAVRLSAKALHELPQFVKGGEPVADVASHVFLPAPGAIPDGTSGLFGTVLFVGSFADIESLRQGIRDKVQDQICLGEQEHVVIGPVGTFLPVAAKGEALQCDQLYCPQDRTEDVRKKSQGRNAQKQDVADSAEPSLFGEDGVSIRPDVLKWKKDKQEARTQKQRDREEYAQKLGVLDAIEMEFEPAHEFLTEIWEDDAAPAPAIRQPSAADLDQSLVAAHADGDAEDRDEETEELVKEALRHLANVRQRRAETVNALSTNEERLKEAEVGAVGFQARIQRLEQANPEYKQEWRGVYVDALRQTGQSLPPISEISEFNPMRYLVLDDDELEAVAPVSQQPQP